MYLRHLTQVCILLAVIFTDFFFFFFKRAPWDGGVYLEVIAGEGKIWCQTNSGHETVSSAILSDSLCQSCLAGVSAGRRGLSGGDFSLGMTHPVASEPVLDGALRLAEST